MLGLKEAGLVGTTAVLAAGVAYLVWVYASNSREKRAEKQPEEGGETDRKEEPRKEGKRDEEQADAVAAEAPKTAAVRRRPERTHRPEAMDTLSKQC